MKLHTYRFSKSHFLYFIYVLFAAGTFLRFFHLSWGAPFYFHPDERNIAMAITRLSPESLNPEFFAYGGLPIYFIYFVGVGVNIFLTFLTQESGDIFQVSFEHAILVSRATCALLSVGVLLLFLRIRAFLPPFVFWVSFVLSIFSVGYIQYAHFGTFEMWLTFFSFLLFVFLLYNFKRGSWRYFLFSSIIFGVLVSIKVSSVILFPVIFLPLLLTHRTYTWKKRIASLLISFFVAGGISILIFLLSNPFFLFDNASYLSSLSYEGSVARGTLPVFYTGRFYETTPIVFHFLRVFPFLLNPLNTLLLGVGIFLCGFFSYRRRDILLNFTIFFFLALFIPQTFLFVKWNRYMVPTLPFAYIIIGFTVSLLLTFVKGTLVGVFQKISIVVLGTIAITFSLSFFVSVYFSDTRVDAFHWARNNISLDAAILSEVYDLGVVPYERDFSNITLVNSYEFGNGEEVPDLSKYEYVLLPSPRILRSRIQLPEYFPEGHSFYSSLMDGSFGYQLVYQTPCDIFCQIAYLGDPIFYLEETANVFDRPTVLIYENTRK